MHLNLTVNATTPNTSKAGMQLILRAIQTMIASRKCQYIKAPSFEIEHISLPELSAKDIMKKLAIIKTSDYDRVDLKEASVLIGLNTCGMMLFTDSAKMLAELRKKYSPSFLFSSKGEGVTVLTLVIDGSAIIFHPAGETLPIVITK